MPSLAKLSSPRPSVAYRLAELRDLPRVRYTVSLGAWREPADLSDRARRVLRWFAALNRCGEVGFTGFRAPLGAAAASCRAATGEASSRATFCRGLAELVARGYIENGTFRGGKPREYTPGNWARDPIAVYSITDRGLAVWGAARGSLVALPSEAPRAPSNVARLPGDSTSRAASKPASPGRSAELSHIGSPVSVCDGDEMPENPVYSNRDSRARVVPCASDRAGFEAAREVESPGKRATFDGARGAEVEPPGKRAAVIDSPSARGAARKGERKRRAKARAAIPCPTIPTTRPLAARAILATLALCVKWRGRDGKAALARAALELSDPSAAAGSPVRWDHWIARWGSLTGAERMRIARAEILAVMEPSVFAKSTNPAYNPGERWCPVAEPPPKPAASPPPPRRDGEPEHVGQCFDPIDLMREAAAAGNDFARQYLSDRGLL